MFSIIQRNHPNHRTALASVLARNNSTLNSPNSGSIKPDVYDLVHLLKLSTDSDHPSHCYQLHGYILKSGFAPNSFISNALMKFYKGIDSLSNAHKVFDEMPQRNVVSWNSLISWYKESGQLRKASGMFIELERSDLYADAYSFSAALAACGAANFLWLGKSIHSKIVKCGMGCGNVVVANCLINMYGKCGFVEDAVGVFDCMIVRDIVSWNSVIAASARNGNLEQAFWYWNQAPERDTITYNELVSGIAQFGDIDDAVGILSTMPNPNSSSWTAVLTGYVNRNSERKALELFGKMHCQDVRMDEYTFSVILSGIARLGSVTWGKLIHCCTVKRCFDASVVVGSALVDMYAKCGQMEDAESMFWSLRKKNVITWNAMISGYAHNGDYTKVIGIFEEMKAVNGMKPDSITFLNLLAACSHTEIPLQKVFEYLESMIEDHEIEPGIEHCCSMIRLLGLRGEAWRAEKMISELGFGAFGVAWRALLGACGACKDLRVAKIATAKVIVLGGMDDYVYVMMSNIFAHHGKWGKRSLVRKVMRDKGVRKEIGCSWIEIENSMSNS